MTTFVATILIILAAAALLAELGEEAGSPPVRVNSEAVPRYMTDGSAAADLLAQEKATIEPGQRTLIRTGVFAAVPPGHAALVCSRSGLALKNGVIVANAPGIIDPDYRGEWKVILANISQQPFTVEPGMRVAQILIIPASQHRFELVENLDETERGSGGFGHTG